MAIFNSYVSSPEGNPHSITQWDGQVAWKLKASAIGINVDEANSEPYIPKLCSYTYYIYIYTYFVYIYIFNDIYILYKYIYTCLHNYTYLV